MCYNVSHTLLDSIPWGPVTVRGVDLPLKINRNSLCTKKKSYNSKSCALIFLRGGAQMPLRRCRQTRHVQRQYIQESTLVGNEVYQMISLYDVGF